jgi:hypothetical protein
MPLIATGINKLLTFKKQAGGIGTAAGPTTAQNLRRVSSTLDKKKATYTSKELRPSQQRSDMRHGVIGVDGTISGELSIGTYQSFTESMLRALVSTAVTVTTAVSDIVTAAVGANGGTITATAANFVTGNMFKVGMVIRAAGFTTTAINNNAKNLFIISLTNKVMGVVTLDGSAFVAKTETAAVTLTEVGKHIIIPQSGALRDYYTIEHNFVDIAQSERFTDCVITQLDVKLPASGMATVDFGVMGLNMTTGTAGYFTSPAPVSQGANLAAANGVVYMQGAAIGLITGMNIAVKGNHSVIGGVVGSNVEPDIFPGSIDVDGQVTVLFTDAVVRDYFLNETEVSLYCAFTTDNTSTAGFQAISLPRVKMGGASKDDGEKGLVMTMPFTALENVAGGAGTNSHQTTICIQDSAFV